MLTEELKKKYCDADKLTPEKLQGALDEAIDRTRKYLKDFTDKFPGAASKDLVYPQTDNMDWTEGFYTGVVWLCYEMTKDEAFKKTAEKHVQSFKKRIENRVVVDHHDMGFLYTPSCVAAYKLTGNEDAKAAALMAADNLKSRFQEKGQFIQAWGKLGAEDNYRLIIDCLLNLPLLYWATETTGDESYRNIAVAHLKTAMKVIVRDDYSTYHTYFFDPETGAPLKGATHQGFADDSPWARGQAWGVYGFLLNYGYTHMEELIPLFFHVTDFFLERTGADQIAYWDLIFTDGDEPRDTSASAVVICGLLYAYEHGIVGEDYLNVAKSMLNSLIDHYTTKDIPRSNGLLTHSTYHKKGNIGVNECNTWADYFYMEALVRLSKKWEQYW